MIVLLFISLLGENYNFFYVIFGVNFPQFWLIICYPEPIYETNPDPGGRIETDQNESESEILFFIKDF